MNFIVFRFNINVSSNFDLDFALSQHNKKNMFKTFFPKTGY